MPAASPYGAPYYDPNGGLGNWSPAELLVRFPSVTVGAQYLKVFPWITFTPQTTEERAASVVEPRFVDTKTVDVIHLKHDEIGFSAHRTTPTICGDRFHPQFEVTLSGCRSIPFFVVQKYLALVVLVILTRANAWKRRAFATLLRTHPWLAGSNLTGRRATEFRAVRPLIVNVVLAGFSSFCDWSRATLAGTLHGDSSNGILTQGELYG
jgi:hypothetical protein